MQAESLAPPFAIAGGGDCRRDADDGSFLALAQVDGGEPAEIRPLAERRTMREGSVSRADVRARG